MSSEAQQRAQVGPPAASRPQVDAAIAAIGGRQKQIVTLRQFRSAGLSNRGVSHRARRHRLFRMHEQVYALHAPPYSWHQRLLAATYACGEGTFVSDMAAAWLLGATERTPSVPQVTNQSGAGRDVSEIEVHQRVVASRDVIKRYGIPCSSPARTLLDCAASAGIERLEELLMAADSGRPGLDRERLEDLIAENGGRRGIRNLRFLITDDPKENDSTSERRMLRVCRRFGVPEPETQYEIRASGRTYRADLCWPELRLIVECDSWRWHGGKLKVERDSDRDQILAIAGWLVVHFTRNQIKLEPERTGRKLVALTTR